MDYNIRIPVTIPVSRVADLVCSALEGGSTYWCERFEPTRYPKDTMWGHETVAHGVSFAIWPEGEAPVMVKNSPERIAATLQLLADQHLRHWQNFINENDDAETGDVFFQLLCFGEVVYG